MVVSWYYPDKWPASIIPDEDASRDLGASDRRWNYIYGVIAVLTMLTVGNLYVTNFAQIANANLTINSSQGGHLVMDNAGIEYTTAGLAQWPIWVAKEAPSIGYFYNASLGAVIIKTFGDPVSYTNIGSGTTWQQGSSQVDGDIAGKNNTQYGNWLVTPITTINNTCMTECAILNRACVAGDEATAISVLVSCDTALLTTDFCLCAGQQYYAP